jgi:CubicO group peptidase (beta-lactamase class C family)
MTLEPDVDPDAIGLDPARLGRLERHLDRYIASGRLVGTLTVIARGGRVGYLRAQGRRDASRPVTSDTIWRIYSMTKPITSVAALMLCEEGSLSLLDPVSDHLPAFGDARVLRFGPAERPRTVPAQEPMRVWHLLTHTAGLTYGFMARDAVDAAYRATFGARAESDGTLSEFCDRLATLPLVFEPGSAWNYSHATDVLGRVVEVVSGVSLERFVRERITEPLGMPGTGFAIGEDEADRLADLYAADPSTGLAMPAPERDGPRTVPRAFHSGGGGLVSTARDYLRFLEMLRRGGALDGARLLSPATVARMTANHLPGGVDIPTFAYPSRLSEEFPGRGFGLGVATLDDPVKARTIGSRGEYSWGGAAGTEFWLDPARDLTVLFFTQVLGAPDEHRLRRELRWLVYQALTETPAM